MSYEPPGAHLATPEPRSSLLSVLVGFASACAATLGMTLVFMAFRAAVTGHEHAIANGAYYLTALAGGFATARFKRGPWIAALVGFAVVWLGFLALVRGVAARGTPLDLGIVPVLSILAGGYLGRVTD